jgi:hypothetical protein
MLGLVCPGYQKNVYKILSNLKEVLYLFARRIVQCFIGDAVLLFSTFDYIDVSSCWLFVNGRFIFDFL